MRHKLSFCIVAHRDQKHYYELIENIAPYADEIVFFYQYRDNEDDWEVQELRDAASYEAYFWKARVRIEVVPWLGLPENYRTQAIQACRNEWVFMIDCDERLPANCGDKLDLIIDYAESNSLDIVGVPRRSVVVDHNYVDLDAVMGSDIQFRLLRRDYVTWPNRVHSQPRGRKIGFVSGPVITHLWEWQLQDETRKFYENSLPEGPERDALVSSNAVIYGQFWAEIQRQQGLQ